MKKKRKNKKEKERKREERELGEKEGTKEKKVYAEAKSEEPLKESEA